MRLINNQEKLIKKILVSIFFISFIITVCNIFTGLNLGFHSDTATANLLAREQIYSKQLFPENWVYGTGIWILYYNILMIPISLFTDNEILIRNIAVFITVLFFLYILYYLIKKVLKSDSWILIGCFLFSSTSPTLMDMFFAQAAYLPGMIEIVILLILFFKSYDSNYKLKSKKNLIMLLIFICYLCLYGTLSIAYYSLPLIGAITLEVYLSTYSVTTNNILKQIKKPIVCSILIFSCTLVGLVGNKFINKIVGYTSQTNVLYESTNDMLDNFLPIY